MFVLYSVCLYFEKPERMLCCCVFYFDSGWCFLCGGEARWQLRSCCLFLFTRRKKQDLKKKSPEKEEEEKQVNLSGGKRLFFFKASGEKPKGNQTGEFTSVPLFLCLDLCRKFCWDPLKYKESTKQSKWSFFKAAAGILISLWFHAEKHVSSYLVIKTSPPPLICILISSLMLHVF